MGGQLARSPALRRGRPRGLSKSLGLSPGLEAPPRRKAGSPGHGVAQARAAEAARSLRRRARRRPRRRDREDPRAPRGGTVRPQAAAARGVGVTRRPRTSNNAEHARLLATTTSATAHEIHHQRDAGVRVTRPRASSTQTPTTCHRHEQAERATRGFGETQTLSRQTRAIIDRAAIPDALTGHDLLTCRRASIWLHIFATLSLGGQRG